MKYKRTVYQALTMISQFSINILVPVFLCSFIGIFLDRKLGTSYFMVVFFFIGALAGFRNIFLMAKGIYKDGGKKQSHERADKRIGKK